MENKKYYFFSDVHLGLKSKEEERLKETRVVNFLDSVKTDAEKIYIVGDLFDCWIEYRRVVPKGYYRLLAKLNELVELGIEINFLSGNHDFWLNTYLRDDVGLKISNEPLIFEKDNKSFFVAHGDGLAKGDTGYKIIKKILRSPVNQFLYSLIHPDIGIMLAQGSSRTSRVHTEDSAKEKDNSKGKDREKGKDGEKGIDSMKNFAVKKIEEGFDYVVMGHHHKPQKIEISRPGGNGFYITLGDWIKNDSYGVFENGNFELKFWKKA